LKQGIKTGIAGTITYAIYAGWNLPQGYWAVFAALVVTQANVGASWKAAPYRTIGSTSGALAAALLLPLLGTGVVRAGIALFLLASFFAYLTAIHPGFSAAGFTAALDSGLWRFAGAVARGLASRALYGIGCGDRFCGRSAGLARARTRSLAQQDCEPSAGCRRTLHRSYRSCAAGRE
jgi:hypothetical protein